MESPMPATQSLPSSASPHPVLTPSSSVSRRRSSISSGTPSQRRRKGHSLQDVASSLGQRTPDRSQNRVATSPTRSRQLDFGSDDVEEKQKDKEEDNEKECNSDTREERDSQGDMDVAEGGDEGEDNSEGPDVDNTGDEEIRTEHGEGSTTIPEDERAVSGGEAANVTVSTVEDTSSEHVETPRKRQRRETVFWTPEEEEFLRAGVAMHGTGKWKKILIDGAAVFSDHRTNVDLKDKWKNLHFGRPKRQRRRRDQDDDDDAAPTNRTVRPLPRLNVAMATDQTRAVIATTENSNVDQDAQSRNSGSGAEDKNQGPDHDHDHDYDDNVSTSNQPSRHARLNFVTDDLFPEFVAISVNLDTCLNVNALKELLRSDLLSGAAQDTEIQLIAVKSRCLVTDDEQLPQCIRNHGQGFYIVLDDSPEEFVERVVQPADNGGCFWSACSKCGELMNEFERLSYMRMQVPEFVPPSRARRRMKLFEQCGVRPVHVISPSSNVLKLYYSAHTTLPVALDADPRTLPDGHRLCKAADLYYLRCHAQDAKGWKALIGPLLAYAPIEEKNLSYVNVTLAKRFSELSLD